MDTFDNWQEAKEAQEENDGVAWRHDAGHYAVTESHSDADVLASEGDEDGDKWTEIE